MSESETPAGWLYRYRIVNDFRYQVGDLTLGDPEGGKYGFADTTAGPIAIASPAGWRGVLAASEDAPDPVVMWQVSELLDAASRVDPGASLGDFNLVFAERCSECTRLLFETGLLNAGSTAGTVELVAADPSPTPLVVSIDQPVSEQILVGLTTLKATVSDPSSIVSLRFERDASPMSGGTPVSGEITAPPFVSTWDTRTAEDGIELLVAVATDAEGRTTRSAEVVATVANGPANHPPTVSAGPDQTVTLPNPATLDGTVTDDGLPNPPGAVTTTWSKVSGPGTVNFGNASAVDTTTAFSTPGNYVLRLTANDGARSTDDGVRFTVNSQGPLSVIKRGTIHSSTDASAYSFPSITASNNLLYIGFLNTSANSATAPTATSVSGAGLSFTEIGTTGGLLYSATPGVRRIQAWRALSSAGATTGTIAINLNGTPLSMDAALLEFSGTDTSGTNGSGALTQSATNQANNATSLSVTLAAFGSPNNRPVAFFSHRAEEATTPESGHTELDDGSHRSPVTGAECEWNATTPDTTPSASWLTAADAGGFAIEVKAGGSP